MTEAEPEFTADDRAAALAYLAELRETCPDCANQISESMDRKTAGTWTVDRHVCQACLVREAVIEGDAEGKRPRGVKYLAHRTPGVS